jgi:hypothetical protein
MRSGGAVAVVAVLLLVVLPLLYVLSVGPAVWVHESGMLSPGGKHALETIYLPVEWAAYKSQVISTPLMWYIDLWKPAQSPLPAPSLPPTATTTPPAATTPSAPQ